MMLWHARSNALIYAVLLAGTVGAVETSAPRTLTAPANATEEALLDDLAAALGSPQTIPAPPPPTPAAKARAMNPAISAILDVAAVLQDTDASPPGGKHDPVEEGFVLQALEFSIQGAVDPYFQLNLRPVVGAEGVELEKPMGKASYPGIWEYEPVSS